jgi:hypothetical protein
VNRNTCFVIRYNDGFRAKGVFPLKIGWCWVPLGARESKVFWTKSCEKPCAPNLPSPECCALRLSSWIAKPFMFLIKIGRTCLADERHRPSTRIFCKHTSGGQKLFEDFCGWCRKLCMVYQVSFQQPWNCEPWVVYFDARVHGLPGPQSRRKCFRPIQQCGRV